MVAELLLKRTTATAAARVYEEFLDHFPSVKALAASSEERLATVLSKVGLQWQRATTTKSLADYLMRKEAGETPSSLDRLLRIPGLGEYSARAVLSFGFGVPVALLDANVERIFQRVFLEVMPGKPPRSLLQAVADDLIPKESHREFNFGLLDLGALVCRYAHPKCDECPIDSICDFRPSAGTRKPLSSRMRETRLAKRMGLAELARKAGVSKLTIINVEAGRTKPRPETLRKVASVLEVAPEDLVDAT